MDVVDLCARTKGDEVNDVVDLCARTKGDEVKVAIVAQCSASKVQLTWRGRVNQRNQTYVLAEAYLHTSVAPPRRPLRVVRAHEAVLLLLALELFQPPRLGIWVLEAAFPSPAWVCACLALALVHTHAVVMDTHAVYVATQFNHGDFGAKAAPQ